VPSADPPITSERNDWWAILVLVDPLLNQGMPVIYFSLILILWNWHTLVSSLVSVICQFSADAQTCFAWDWSSCEQWQMFLNMLHGRCSLRNGWTKASLPGAGHLKRKFWITTVSWLCSGILNHTHLFLGSEISHMRV